MNTSTYRRVRKITRISSLAFSVVLTLAAAVHAQDRYTIKTADGVLHVNNSDSKSFTLEIKGKDIRPQQVDDNIAYGVDGRVVQVVITKIKDVVPAGKSFKDDEILDLHRKWETDYAAGIYKETLKTTVEREKIENRQISYWYFTRPSHNEQFDRDFFVSTVIGDYILVLSSPLPAGAKIGDYKDYLTTIVKTLKVSDKPFDIKKLADEIRKS